jgi:threonine dehydratase
MTDITLIRAAEGRLAPVVRRTPLLSSPFLDAMAGRRVLVKAECLQHTGSFKFRGAWSAISALSPELRSRGIVAFSSGNHAQGVALAAARHGVKSVIIMPDDAPALKIANTRALGAEVVLHPRDDDLRQALGRRYAEERGMVLVKPFDDPQVIAGQGTIGLEIAAQARAEGVDRADVLVPCGGGGMSSGIALALADIAPGLRVRPAEPEGFSDTSQSLASGTRQRNASDQGSLCDAILTPSPGEITFPILARHCGPGLIISDEEALLSMAYAFLRLKLVLEPGGAAGLAAALFRKDEIAGDAVIVVASGGNVDPAVFSRAMGLLDRQI